MMYPMRILLFLLCMLPGLCVGDDARKIKQISDQELEIAVLNDCNMLLSEGIMMGASLRSYYNKLQEEFLSRDELEDCALMLLEQTRNLGPSQLAIILNKICEIQSNAEQICFLLESIYSVLATNFDITGVFTAIQEIKDEILETQSIICEKFTQTWTLLGETEDLIIDTKTILIEKNLSTFTIIEKIFETGKGSGEIENLFAQTWTILGCMTSVPVTSAITITNPGSYCLINDIVGSIVIASDGVFLDLNNHTISGAATLIECSNQLGIVIENGYLDGGSTNGVLISTCTNVIIQNIDFIDNGIGVNVLTTSAVSVKNCTFRGHTTAGIRYDRVGSSQIENCILSINTAPVIIDLLSSNCLNVQDVIICENSVASGTFDGIRGNNVASASFENCRVEHNIGQMVNADTPFLPWNFSNCAEIVINKSTANNNRARGRLSGFEFQNCNGALLQECLANSNNLATGSSATNSLRGYNMLSTVAVTIQKSMCVNNVSVSQHDSFFVDATSNFACIDCISCRNQSSVAMDGFSIRNGAQSCILKNCTVMRNTSSTTLFAFRCNANNNLFESCNVINNTSTGSFQGFRFTSSAENNCLLRCVVKGNTGGGADQHSFIFFGGGTTKNLVRYCISQDNTGGGTFNSFADDFVNNVILENIAQGNQTTGGNYTGVPASLITNLNPGTGYTSAAGDFRNISVVLP